MTKEAVINYWECPYCKRRMTDIEYQAYRFDYHCPTKKCNAPLSRYHPKVKKIKDE